MLKSTSPLRAASDSLAGATIIVTRPVGAAAALKRRIVALGGVALGLPGITLRALDDPTIARRALTLARTADAAIFSSPAAVRFAFRLQPRLGFARTTHVVAVGAGTARALARRGIKHVLVPARTDSEGVLALPELASVRGQRIVLIGASGGRELLSQTLRKRGARVHAIHVYRRAAARLDRRHFIALESASPPLITLLSSVQVLKNLCKPLPPDLLACLLDGECVVSSARLARAARTAGYTRVLVAASAAPVALIETACTALARHRL